MKVAAIIPARGGSKGLPRKNILEIAGRPLIAWSIESAIKSELVSEVYVSTEDEEITEVSLQYGAKVINRPAFLAEDDSTTAEVLNHAVKLTNHDAYLVLQPTSPLRYEGSIDKCVDKFIRSEADTLVTGYNVTSLEYGSHQNLRRQDIKGYFYDDGNIYIHKRQVLLDGDWFGKKIERFTLSKEERFEIDDKTDFVIVETLLQHYLSSGLECSDYV